MAATKAVSGNTAKSGEKKKPRGKPFTGADDPRNNANGQRSRAVVATAAQARELYVTVLHEPHNATIDAGMSNLELIVRQHVAAARKGDATQREQMLDRIWGKALQSVELNGTLQHEHRGKLTIEQIKALSDDELARLESDAIGRPSAITR